MPENHQIEREKKRQTSGLLNSCPELLKDFPIKSHVKNLKSFPKTLDLTQFGTRELRSMDKIENTYGLKAMSSYQKLVLLELIKESMIELDERAFPEEIGNFYGEWFDRVLKDFSKQPDSYYTHENEAFSKDLAVCSLRAVPVGGAWIVTLSQVRDKVLTENQTPKKFYTHLKSLLKNTGAYKNLKSIFGRLGIFESFYTLHTVDRYLPRFTPAEMEKSYVRIAELLKRKVKVRGLYRSSWFLDPALESISPHLAFLRRVPEENGATVFRIGTRQIDIDKSILLSPIRKKLYDEGKYIPTCYAYFWPREKLIEWAENLSRVSD